MTIDKPNKTVKIQSNNKLSGHIQALRSLDERVKAIINKQEKYKLRAQEIGLATSYLLAHPSDFGPKIEELQNLILQKCLSLGQDLNFDPDTRDDEGTFVLFGLLLKAIWQLNQQISELEKKHLTDLKPMQ